MKKHDMPGAASLATKKQKKSSRTYNDKLRGGIKLRAALADNARYKKLAGAGRDK